MKTMLNWFQRTDRALLSPENILFGLPFDEQRYKKVLYACALVSDLKILDDGDDTEIGEQVTPNLT